MWLGNIPLKPNRAAMEALFSRFGPLESVRVFPGKTFAFVNFVHAAHAIQAKAALDGQPSPHITGPKPLVIRFQKDTAGVPPPGTVAKANVDVASARARSEYQDWCMEVMLCSAEVAQCAAAWCGCSIKMCQTLASWQLHDALAGVVVSLHTSPLSCHPDSGVACFVLCKTNLHHATGQHYVR
jgi:hypothetical protein